MLAHGAKGAMEAARDGVAWTALAPRCGFFAAQPGTLSAGDAAWPLPARTLAWFDEAPAAALTFRADAAARGTIGWWLGFTANEA
jgi:hypothetical protein